MTKHAKNTRADKKSDAQEGLGFGTVDIWERHSEYIPYGQSFSIRTSENNVLPVTLDIKSL